MSERTLWDEWFVPEVGSTMDWARRLTTMEESSRSPIDALRVRTGRQLGGRGRRGAPWWDAPGASILTTLAVRRGGSWDPKDRNPASMALRAGLAVARALEEFDVADVAIKWPNDIQVEHRKVGGILVEADPRWFYVGLGLNVGPPEIPVGAVEEPQMVVPGNLGRMLPRNVGIHSVIHVLDRKLAEAVTTSDWVRPVRGRLAWKGRAVRLQFASAPDATGTLTGIDEDGAILITEADGGRAVRYLVGTLRPENAP